MALPSLVTMRVDEWSGQRVLPSAVLGVSFVLAHYTLTLYIIFYYNFSYSCGGGDSFLTTGKNDHEPLNASHWILTPSATPLFPIADEHPTLSPIWRMGNGAHGEGGKGRAANGMY